MYSLTHKIILVAAFSLLTLVSPAQQVINMGSTNSVTTCDALFYDSGGPDQPPPTTGATSTLTFSPDGPDKLVKITFNEFDLGQNTLMIYDGGSTSGFLIGQYSKNNPPGVIVSNSSNGKLTVKFSSYFSDTGTGWKATVSCCSAVKAGTATPSTDKACFGGVVKLKISGDYCGMVSWQRSYDGSQWETIDGLKGIDVLSPPVFQTTYFRSIFKMGNDSVMSNPVTVTADNTCFGLKADSVRSCDINFYDGGGADAMFYGAESGIVTIYPSAANDKVKLKVNGYAFYGNFGFKIYDGNSTSAPLLYSSDNPGFIPWVMVSSAEDGSLTIDADIPRSTGENGWDMDMEFSCCSSLQTSEITVYGDSIHCGNSSLNVFSTFDDPCASLQWQSSSDRITWTDMEGEIDRDLWIQYITVTTYYRLKFSLKNEVAYSKSFPVYVYNNCIEMQDNLTYSVCDGLFTDEGGVSGNYNGSMTGTLMPSSPGKKLKLDFVDFQMQNFAHFVDTLLIYNGTSTSAPLIGKFMDGYPPATINSTAPDGSLTFHLKVIDSFWSAPGWKAVISCTGPAALEENGRTDELTVYPNPSANGIFTIELGTDDGPVKYAVSNMLGEEVISARDPGKTDGNLKIDLSGFKAGVYSLSLTSGNIKRVVRLVKN